MAWMYLDSSIMGDKEAGPLSDQQFIKMIELKKIKNKTQVYHPKRTKGEWVQARQVPAFQKTIERLKAEQQGQKEREKTARVEKIAEAERERAQERLQEERQAAAVAHAERDQFMPRHYVVAESLAVLFRFGAIFGIVAIFAGCVFLGANPAGAAVAIGWGLGTFIINSAFSEGLRIFLDIQQNTDKTAHFTELMWQATKEKQ